MERIPLIDAVYGCGEREARRDSWLTIAMKIAIIVQSIALTTAIICSFLRGE